MYKVSALVFLVTFIMFIVYWWKKRKVRISAGDDYSNDQKYQEISKIKRIVGVACVISLLICTATQPELTPEEKAIRAQKQQSREQENREKELQTAFDKHMREVKEFNNEGMKKTKNTSIELRDWKFLGTDSMEFISNDKAIIRWSEQIYSGKYLIRTSHEDYFIKFDGKWKWNAELSNEWRETMNP